MAPLFSTAVTQCSRCGADVRWITHRDFVQSLVARGASLPSLEVLSGALLWRCTSCDSLGFSSAALAWEPPGA